MLKSSPTRHCLFCCIYMGHSCDKYLASPIAAGCRYFVAIQRQRLTETKVAELHSVGVIQQHIFWLDISVYDTLAMDVSQR